MTIISLPDPTCTLQEEVYNVNEEGEGFVEIVVQTTDPDAVGTSCVLSTQDITAVGGSKSNNNS